MRSLVFVLVSALSLAVAAGAQTPAPPQGRSTEATMTRINEGGEYYVVMQEFLGAIQNFDPNARGMYDPRGAILRIEAGGKQFDVLERQPVIVINGRGESVARPLLKRQGRILVPESTVRKILGALNIEVSSDKPAGATPEPAATKAAPTIPTNILGEPTPAPAGTPKAPAAPAVPPPLPDVSPTPTPAYTPETTETPAPTATPTPVIPETIETPTPAPTRPPVTIVPSRPKQVKTPSEGEAPLQPPQALAGSIGLSWAQLTDLAHRQPPSRITIVCDRLLDPVAQQIGKELQERIQIESAVVVAPTGQRAQDSLVMQVAGQQPQLVIDLIASRQDADSADKLNDYGIWVVNSALWPGRQGPGNDPLANRYAIHEFQSLALGSLLRTEMGRQFPDQTITYGLAPSYLLRRVDAPSASVLIPLAKKQESVEGERADHIATAVSAAVIAYVHGMSQSGF